MVALFGPLLALSAHPHGGGTSRFSGLSKQAPAGVWPQERRKNKERSILRHVLVPGEEIFKTVHFFS
jgi:ribosomal protein L2